VTKIVVLYLLAGTTLMAATIVCPGSGAIGGQTSLTISCGGLTIGGFSNVYNQPFGVPGTPVVENSGLQLLSVTSVTGDPGGDYVQLSYHTTSTDGLVGGNFSLTGWQGGFVRIITVFPLPPTHSYSQINFCRPGHDIKGPTYQIPTVSGFPIYSWLGCYDASGTQYASLGGAFGGSPPVESADSAGVVDIGASSAGTSATLPGTLTARLVDYGHASSPDFNVQIQVLPEPSAGWVVATVLICIAGALRRKRRTASFSSVGR
jgi:hypothetical protein